MHRHGDEVGVYTRSLADITHRVPEIVEIVRSLPVHDIILDGETPVARRRRRAATVPGDHVAVRGRGLAGASCCGLGFFDMLHVDGRDLLDEPLSTRLAELERVAGQWRMPGIVTADADAAEQLSHDALAAGHEGVVVKAIDAPYAAGAAARRGSRSSRC